MAIDRWFIGGGAEHTPESARRLVYASTGGAEGVGGVNDLKVMPLAVPGAGVRVVVGSALIKSRYVGGETQTYMGTVYEQETVSIAATGSGSARSDLIVLRVEDPFAAGSPWPTPSPVETAPYVHVRVISGVPAGTTRLQDVPGYANDTALTLARVDLPVSTGTVTTALIVDLRKLAQGRNKEDVFHVPSGQTTTLDLVATSPVPWPANTFARVEIPEWATHAYISGDIIGYTVQNASTAGRLYARIDDNGGSLSVQSPGTYYNEQLVTYGGRWTWPVGGKVAIPSTMRGKTLWLRTMGTRIDGSGYLRAGSDAMVRWNVTWAEEI